VKGNVKATDATSVSIDRVFYTIMTVVEIRIVINSSDFSQKEASTDATMPRGLKHVLRQNSSALLELYPLPTFSIILKSFSF